MTSPSLTIQSWSKTLKAGEVGAVAFALAVPVGHQIVSIVATLRREDGATAASAISAMNANAVTGMRLPSVAPGLYWLTMRIDDDQGGSDTTALRRDVVVS